MAAHHVRLQARMHPALHRLFCCHCREIPGNFEQKIYVVILHCIVITGWLVLNKGLCPDTAPTHLACIMQSWSIPVKSCRCVLEHAPAQTLPVVGMLAESGKGCDQSHSHRCSLVTFCQICCRGHSFLSCVCLSRPLRTQNLSLLLCLSSWLPCLGIPLMPCLPGDLLPSSL